MSDMKHLRIHSTPVMDSRLFIQFTASVILSKARHINNLHTKLKHYFVRQSMEKMEIISDIKISNKKKSITTRVGLVQRLVAEHFGMPLKT